MKFRTPAYTQAVRKPTIEPRFVFAIEYGAADLEYFTSHANIPDIPAGAIEGVLEDWSAVSQSVDPTTGTSSIGSLTVLLVDRAGVFTDDVQLRLASGTGLRDKRVFLWKGTAGMSFNDFEQKYTQQVQQVSEDRARYIVRCSDLQRSMRSEVFQLKVTRLAQTLSATETLTMNVDDTTGFERVAHGSSYSHGPNETWGYLLIDEEIIGYQADPGATTFTNLERGLFGTLPAEHAVNPADPAERRPEVTEYVYLELPVPKAIRAIMTGELYGQPGQTLPDDWHMGIPLSLIDDDSFTGIGVDLWDPNNDAVGLIAPFRGITAINGKRFIESECHRLAQTFNPVLADGTLGLKRLVPALASAPHVEVLNETNVISAGPLSHNMRKVINRAVINWSWILDEFRRQTIKIDADSIAIHGEAPIKTYDFRGLAANIATDTVIDQRFDALRDRFSSPPLEITVQVFKYLDVLELADIVRLNLQSVRDMSAESENAINRAFEIRRISESRRGPLTFDLVGSSAKARPVAPVVNALPDTFYNAIGTELSTVVTIAAGATGAGTFTLTGGADATAAGSVFYYLGDLTISANTTINLDDNVQLRVRGFLTVNGTINGNGRGLLGQADVAGVGAGPGGLAGYFGTTRGRDGVEDSIFSIWITRPPDTAGTLGQVTALPLFNLSVDGDTLAGLPTDLRGTSGGPGGKLVNNANGLVAQGGAGGDGGAGLIIVSRGLSAGLGGVIDLGGGDAVAGNAGVLDGTNFFSGAGAAGAPGALLVLQDGNRTLPDLAGVFSATAGASPLQGTPIRIFWTPKVPAITAPGTGRDSPAILDGDDFSDAALRIQYIPVPETPVDDLPGTQATYYIAAVDGTIIRNGVGNLTLEAHRILNGNDEVLATGTVQLFDPSNLVLTAANGYQAGSDGYTGILDSSNINGDIVIELRNGAAGDVFDSVTLVDIVDGSGPPGSDGADAIFGAIEPENGTAWSRAPNAGAWTPAQLTTDLDCTFFQGGVEIARISRRVTLNAADGTLSATATTHPGGDLNTGRVTVTVTGTASTAITVQFDYSFGGETSTIAETVVSAVGGTDGDPGNDGNDGADAVYGAIEPENGTAWTRAPNAGAWTPAQLTTDLDCTFFQAGVEVARIARRVTLNTSNGTLTAAATTHPGGDLNTGRVTVSVTGSASTSIVVQYAYSFGGESATIAETVTSSLGGTDGGDGQDGTDGDDGLSSQLTNEAFVVNAGASGAGYDLTGSGGTHRVFDGTLDVTTSAVHSIVGGTDQGATWTRTQNGLTLTVTEATGAYSLSAPSDSWTTDQETFTLRATYLGRTFDKEYVITKANDGNNGADSDGFVVTLTGGNTTHSNSSSATAGFRVLSTGFVQRRQGGNYTSIVTATDWIIPRTGIPERWIRATLLSGSLTGGTLNTWQSLTSNREWFRTEDFGGAPTVSLLLEIASDAAGVNVLDDGVYIFTADNTP